MATFDCDYFVIGAGSGGVRSSRIAAGLGARVMIAEDYRVGGTCVIRGCVPKKLLTYAAHFHEDFEDARGYGWTVGTPTFSWSTLIENKDREIARLEGIYRKLLAGSGVTLVEGRARVVDPHTVEVSGRRITAAHILVATGGWPRVPAIAGAELGITSNEAFELKALPRRVLIVGGGYIAVEFAGIFRGLGSEVTISYRGDQILRGFDADVRTHLAAELRKKGIRILLASDVMSLAKAPGGGIDVVLDDASVPGLTVDAVLFATGRVPNTANLGLEAVGVELNAEGAVVVDAHGTSSVPSIHAAGDVTHRIALTPVAIREGQAIAQTLFGKSAVAMDHRDVPAAVFSQPPVSVVGLSEEEAVAAFGEVEIYKTDFKPLKHTLSGRDERTLMKLVVDRASQRVVGAHMVGADAPEIIQGLAIAVKAGLTKQQFDATVGIHPTAAEEFVTLKTAVVVRRD
jgi:glutathione reductase (NADPH)